MPFYGLVVTFFLIYVQPGYYFPVINQLMLGTILPILVFMISIFVKSRVKHSDIWKSGITKLLLFFILLVVISAVFKPELDALNSLKLIVGHFFLYYSICRIADTEKKLKGVFLTLGLVHIILIILNPDLILHPETRSYVEGVTFLGDGNDFSLSLCVSFALVLYLYLEATKKYPRLFYLSVTAITTLAIVGTQSRGASLAMAGILFYLWLKSRRKAAGVMALVMLSVVVVLFAAPAYFSRMGSITNTEESSAQGRIDAWKAGVKMFKSNPALGVGAGNFGSLWGKTAHSMYVLALAELGFPGIFFILTYIALLMRGARHRLKLIGNGTDDDTISKKRMFIHLNGSLIGFAVAGTFLSVLYYPHIFVIGALFFVAHRIYELDKEEATTSAGTEFDENNGIRVGRAHKDY